MYLEFRLPTGAGGQAAAHANYLLCEKLVRWSERHGVPMRRKTIKYTLRVTFDDERFYSFFATTWQASNDWQRFRVISDLNNRQD
jgi:hypothetical protein